MSIQKMCDYGCGHLATYQFKNGKWCCSKHHHQCPARRKVISRIIKEKMRTESIESKNKRYEKLKELHKDEGFKKRFSNSVKNGMNKETVKKKLCKNAKEREKDPDYKKHKIETIKNKWIDDKSIYNSNEYRNKLSKSIKRSHNKKEYLIKRSKQSIEMWKDYEYRNNHINMMKGKWADMDSSYNSEERSNKIRRYMFNGGAQIAIKGIKNPSRQECIIREIVKELFPGCEYQYSILNYSIDVAIPKYKIAIEYDGYYHFNSEESINYHNERQKEIEKLGWRFLRYNYFQVLPGIKKIKKDIEGIINGVS